jgi:hypothetical protein
MKQLRLFAGRGGPVGKEDGRMSNNKSAHALEAIDRLLDCVADYHTIMRPSKRDFAKLESIHAEANSALASLALSLPPIDEAGLPVFVESPHPSGSYHTTWYMECIPSPERHDRWRRTVREARRHAEQAAYAEPVMQFNTPWPP